MIRLFLGTIAATLAVAVAASTLPTAWARDLPANINLGLKLSATESEQALLDAVGEAVAANPELASEVIDAAIALEPALAEEIRATATAAAGGEIAVVPAAGPLGFALAPILGGAGAAGAVAAAATGGGGGSGGDDTSAPAPTPAPPNSSPPQSPNPPQPPNVFETAEYLASNGLAAINASAAYGRGLTGAGVIVAVLDTGLDVTHAEFLGRVAPGGFNFVGNNTDVSDLNGHGSHVAGIVAANRNGVDMHGVAYGASILPVRIGNAAGGIPLSTTGLAAAADHAVANGAFVLNNSWGVNGVQVTDLTTQQIFTQIGPEIAAYRRAAAADRVIVFAAHNAGLPNPSPRAGLPFHAPDLQPYWLAVAAIDQSGSIASYSNRCGVAAAWCLAAPGSGIVSVAPGGGTAVKSGTSMATPHVSAAVAILKQLFPELTADVIVQRLLTTANGGGIYANQIIYGQGLLDLEAATRPVGATEVLTGATIADASFQLDDTTLQLGAAFGDGLRNALSGAKLAVFDSQRATFFVDLEPFVQLADSSIDLPGLLKRFGNVDTQTFDLGPTTVAAALAPTQTAFGRSSETAVESFSFTTRLHDSTSMSVSYNEDPSLAFGLHASGSVDHATLIAEDAFAAPFLSMTDDTVAFGTSAELAGLGDLRVGSFSGTVEDGGESKAFGTAMEISMQPVESATVAVQLGVIAEEATFLGTTTQGAFGFAADTPTIFSGISGALALNRKLSLVGSIYTGISRPSPAADSLFSDVSDIRSQSFSIGMVGQDFLQDGDGFGVILNQPLRVSSGTADISITTGRDTAGNLTSSDFSADLAPTGRELDLEVFYSAPLGDDGSITASAALRHQPGHIADASDEGILALRFRRKF